MLKLHETTIKFGGLIAVNNVTTEIREGEIFGLIGPNGAGKTTLFNIISGVCKPTNGKVLFLEKEIQGFPPNRINEMGIARTYQNINLFKNMTALGNVMVGRHSRTLAGVWAAIINTKGKRKEEADSIEKCHEIMKFMEIEKMANSVAGSLPYGTQRRLEIARALASEPKLLLLDEPAAGMNVNEKEDLSNIIMAIRDKGITVLLVEHNMKLVMKVCDTICVLNYGKKIAQDVPKHIQTNEDVVAAYLGGVIDD